MNTTRPGGTSLFTPLHQAAHGNAPVAVIRALVDLGAWRTLENVRGERPVDVALSRGHTAAAEELEPRLVRHVPHGVLATIQKHFQLVIRSDEGALIERYPLRLPELQPLLEVEEGTFFFQVPGMYGGFFYHLVEDGVNAKLVASGASRMWGGHRYEITSRGSVRVGHEFD